MVGAGLGGVAAGQVEHLGGEVDPVRLAGWADPAGRQQHVDAATRSQVQHHLPGMEVGDGDRVAAPGAGQGCRVGQSGEVVVQAGAELIGLRAAARRGPVAGGEGRPGVVVAHLGFDAVRFVHRCLPCRLERSLLRWC